ncbi:DUF1285 domain-containing protein [Oceanobacter mangrovi]|uniref:DUF1285 domain-containing protein n=1 Tax=Oceanobacter mangrovi TaxID=2862510 RepID=UPI001C8D8D80|nr:DUF1285 domain-containing protein [Oceanobacter mangrovi]
MSLQSLLEALGKQPSGMLPPVKDWHPDFCGEIDIRIDAAGNWFHEGGQITREPLVRLFASVLRKDGNDYFLVTPQEKLQIQVEDVPFQIIAIERQNGVIQGITNVGDSFEISASQPFESDMQNGVDVPVVDIRQGLKARLGRNAYYQLIDWCEEDNGRYFVRSGDYRYWFEGLTD